MKANDRLVKARTRLLLEHPWFGSLAMRLKLEEHAQVDTMATDGTALFYNAEFVTKQTDAHLGAIMAHEVLHCALLHPYRRGSRNPQRWNKATDYVINADLKAAGFDLPEDCLLDPKFSGLAADVVYAQLGEDAEQPDATPRSTGSVQDAPPQPQQGQGNKPEPGAPGDQGTPQNAPQQGMTEEDWKIAAEQASAVTRASGKTPGEASRHAKAAQQQPEDWRAILREFIEQTQPSDYSWSSPNRRHIGQGLYLPGMVKENLGTIGIAVDTSGSVSAKVLAAFAAEVQEIVSEARPEAVHVVYCDSAVRSVETFEADDTIELHAQGGGGTRFAPALDHFAQLETSPVAVLYFTDLENGSEKVTEPAFPTLWVTGKNVTKAQPFGNCVRIDAHV